MSRLMSPDRPRHAPDEALSREHYRMLAPRYDENCRRVQALRAEAVDVMGLGPGDRVLDVGCGTGLSFPLVLDRIGPSGLLRGVEHSVEMAEQARARAEHGQWRNVNVALSAAQSAPIAGEFDAPWTLLAERVPGLTVNSRMLGTAYVAWGSIDSGGFRGGLTEGAYR